MSYNATAYAFAGDRLVSTEAVEVDEPCAWVSLAGVTCGRHQTERVILPASCGGGVGDYCAAHAARWHAWLDVHA